MNSISNKEKILVVTPYYKEGRDMIEHCIASVKRQTIPSDHVLVADGFPQAWLDEAPIRHVKLDQAHGDYGNLARGLGALLGIAESYTAIAFLDADNWFDDDHIELCLNTARRHPSAGFIVAQRRFVRPDHSVLETVTPADIPYGGHVDTNCYLFLPRVFHLLHYWSQIPRQLASFGDHIFKLMLQSRYPEPMVSTDRRTVNYLCMFEGVYREKGEVPPEGAKPYVDWSMCQNWLESLSADELQYYSELVSLKLTNSRS